MSIVKVEFSLTHGQEHYDRLDKEWGDIHPVTRSVVLECARYVYDRFKKNVIVTCLIRSVSENKADGGVPQSSHLTARAGDFVVPGILLKEAQELIGYVQKYWGPMICIVYHDAGSGFHFHINTNWPYAVDFTEVRYNA